MHMMRKESKLREYGEVKRRPDLRNPAGRSGKSFVNFGKNSRRLKRRKLKFAHVMDNVQPAMLNDYTEGKTGLPRVCG